MKSVLVGIGAALALSWAGSGAAQTGVQLLEFAAASKRVDAGVARADDWQDSAFLTGFALGAAGTIALLDPQTCLPATGSSAGQHKRVLIQYLEANPAELHFSGTSLAIAAFRKAFPCRKP